MSFPALGKMDLRECKNKGFVKEAKPDKRFALALIKASEKSMKSQELMPLNDTTSGSKVSLAYDALRELLESISISRGYRIYNHECYASFLKETLSESVLGDKFDKLRKIRNSINYYAKEIGADEAKEVLKEMNSLMEKLKKLRTG